MAAVQLVWSIEINPKPEEVILGNTWAMAPQDLHRNIAQQMTGTSNVWLFDPFCHGGRCHIRLHSTAVHDSFGYGSSRCRFFGS